MKTTRIAPGIYKTVVNGKEYKVKSIMLPRGLRWVSEYTDDYGNVNSDDVYFTKLEAIQSLK